MSQITEKEPANGFARLSVLINDETLTFIRDQMQRHNCSATEAVRRMASIASTIQEEVDAGNMVTFAEPNGRTRELCLP